VIRFVQVFDPIVEPGRWVTIGLGTAEAADHHATKVLAPALPAAGEPSARVRVRSESDLSPAELDQAHADIERQAR
jgi:hypothetical protein